MLRDEGEAYAHKLTEAGILVTSPGYLGTVHDVMLLNAITDDPAPRGAIAQATAFHRKAFGQNLPGTELPLRGANLLLTVGHKGVDRRVRSVPGCRARQKPQPA